MTASIHRQEEAGYLIFLTKYSTKNHQVQDLRTSISADDIFRNLLRQRIDRSLRMPRRQHRKRTRVNDSQPLHSVYPSLRIQHRHLIPNFAHLTRPGRMPQLHQRPSDEAQNLFVRPHLRRTGEVLLPDRGPVHESPDLPHALESQDGEFDIRRVGEPVWVDDRVVPGIGRRDGDVAAGKRGDERGGGGR